MPPRKVDPGQYFVLGDHRNSSNDSRSWGLVPRSCIFGKAVFVYWPLARIGPLK
jgi:signal peptidase I